MIRKRVIVTAPTLLLLAVLAYVAVPTFAQASGGSFIGSLHHLATVGSTVPANGDINPYGVAVVPKSVGNLVQGDILVSNFNASSNLQGTGTTIVQVAPNGTLSLFAQITKASLPGACPGGIGLTTALAVLQRGWVVVGSLPTKDGTAATAKAGCLIVLDSTGHSVETFAGSLINGPWDMTAADQNGHASLFVTNVLNGTVAGNGQVVNEQTVIRIDLSVPNPGHGIPERESTTIIGSGFSARTDPLALVIGPTGLAINTSNGADTLYVADSLNNRIAAIPDALNRQTSAHTGNDLTSNGFLNDPLGMTLAPFGDVLTVNGNNGKVVETTPTGTQIDKKFLDHSGTPPGSGCLFGLTLLPDNSGIYFVDDCTNTLNTLT